MDVLFGVLKLMSQRGLDRPKPLTICVTAPSPLVVPNRFEDRKNWRVCGIQAARQSAP
jgi:hypothetical protein